MVFSGFTGIQFNSMWKQYGIGRGRRCIMGGKPWIKLKDMEEGYAIQSIGRRSDSIRGGAWLHGNEPRLRSAGREKGDDGTVGGGCGYPYSVLLFFSAVRRLFVLVPPGAFPEESTGHFSRCSYWQGRLSGEVLPDGQSLPAVPCISHKMSVVP